MAQFCIEQQQQFLYKEKMEQQEESLKTHKVGIVTRHSTDARINQNTSIRKDKRAQKFDRRVHADTEDILSKIDDEFLQTYMQNRVPIEQIVSKTLECVFNDELTAKGLSQLWVLCQNTQFHCHDSVIRLLPAERLLQRFVHLMRNSSDLHLPRVAMIVSLIMQNPKEKVNAWNDAMLKTDLVRGIIHFVRAPDRCSKKTQTYLLHALLHFLLSCASPALKEVLEPLRDTMELLMNAKHCHGYVAWYLHIMFQKKRPQPYDRTDFCTVPLWNFVVQSVCNVSIAELLPLPQGQGQQRQQQYDEACVLLLDSLECVYQNAFRGPQSIFLNACKKIGAKQLLEFVQSSLKCATSAGECSSDIVSIARISSDILANWCQMDLEFCRDFMNNCFEVVKTLLCTTNQKQGANYDPGISSVHNNLVSITADYSETDGCSKLLLQQGFFWEYVCNLEKLKYNDKTDACHQLFAIRNTLADVVNLDSLYNDINIFRRVFPDPAYFIEAMTRQYNSTHRNYQGVVQTLICEVLSTCLEWSDNFGQTKLFRGPMKRDEDTGLYYVLERVELEEIDDDVRESAAATLAYYRSEK